MRFGGMRMTIIQLKCFMEIAEQGSFTRAAEKLYISQPTISRHIQLLEEEMQTSLLIRDGRRASVLTPSGQLLYDCLKRCRADYVNTADQIQHLREQMQLNLFLPEDCSPSDKISQKFDGIYRNFPRLDSSISYTDYIHFEEVIAHGSFLICASDTMISDRKYAFHMLTNETDTYYIAASVDHQGFSKDHPPVLEDLTGSPLFLMRSMPQALRSHYVDMVRQKLSYDPSVLLLDSIDTIIFYLKSKKGITICTSWFKYRNDPRILFLPIGKTARYAVYWDPEIRWTREILQIVRSL